jgi:hypothetical protein
MATARRYRNWGEVPANQMHHWLPTHCYHCGAVLVALEREWLARNAQWAEEADLETLQYWQGRLNLPTLDDVREEVARGLLDCEPAYYTIRARFPGSLERDDASSSYRICAQCLSAVEERQRQAVAAAVAAPVAPGNASPAAPTEWYHPN